MTLEKKPLDDLMEMLPDFVYTDSEKVVLNLEISRYESEWVIIYKNDNYIEIENYNKDLKKCVIDTLLEIEKSGAKYKI